MTRTDNSFRNIKFILVFQVATLIAAFITRRIFVLVLTKDYLGLTGTFGDILSLLSLAELGVGTAIVYSLYKPLAEGNHGQLTAIMALYRRVYRIIGIVIAITGASLTPFLPFLIHDLPDIPYLNIIYLLFVLNSSLPYFYAYKQSLIIADQRQYVITGWQNGIQIALYFLQALFLVITHNYFVYLGLQIGATLSKNVILARYADRHYPFLRASMKETLDPCKKQEIVRNVKAMSVHNLGYVTLFGTDNLLIAYFVGLGAAATYSNYLMIVSGIRTLYDYLLRAVTASVGNFCVSEDKEQVLPVFWIINFFVSWLIGFSSVCLALLLNPFIKLWVGADYLFSPEITLIIALNFYVWGMRKAVLMFWNTYGLYWHGRFKPIVECAVNLIISVLLARHFGVAGILTGTIISTLTTCLWIEPSVLFHHAFHIKTGRFFRDYLINTGVTVVAFLLTWSVSIIIPPDGIGWFIVKTLVCVVFSNAVFTVAYFRRNEFRSLVQMFRSRIRQRNCS